MTMDVHILVANMVMNVRLNGSTNPFDWGDKEVNVQQLANVLNDIGFKLMLMVRVELLW